MALPSTPSPRLRSMLSLDASSAWHTSALLSVAIESATLPSRIKNVSNRDTLGNIADLLNVHGKQSVANLQMSFSGVDGIPRSEDAGDEPKDGVRLDMDFRPADEVVQGAARLRNGHHRSAKIFSQVLASRGGREKDEQDGANSGEERSRRMGQREAIRRRWACTTSKPQMLRGLTNQPDTARSLITHCWTASRRFSTATTARLLETIWP